MKRRDVLKTIGATAGGLVATTVGASAGTLLTNSKITNSNVKVDGYSVELVGGENDGQLVQRAHGRFGERVFPIHKYNNNELILVDTLEEAKDIKNLFEARYRGQRLFRKDGYSQIMLSESDVPENEKTYFHSNHFNAKVYDKIVIKKVYVEDVTNADNNRKCDGYTLRIVGGEVKNNDRNDITISGEGDAMHYVPMGDAHRMVVYNDWDVAKKIKDTADATYTGPRVFEKTGYGNVHVIEDPQNTPIGNSWNEKHERIPNTRFNSTIYDKLAIEKVYFEVVEISNNIEVKA